MKRLGLSRKVNLSLTVILMTTGCGGAKGTSPKVDCCSDYTTKTSQNMSAEHGSRLDATSLSSAVRVADWESLKAQILAKIDSDATCGADHSCPRTTVSFEPTTLTPAPQDPVVMIIDSGDSVAAGLRHAGRVLAWYRLDDNGQLVQHNPTFNLQSSAVEIYRLLAGAGGIVPPEATQQIATDFHRVYNDDSWSSYVTSHMNHVFNILSGNAPHAWYVLVDTDTIREVGKMNSCEMGRGARGAPERIRERYNSLANQIKSKIAQHKVNFLNFSRGYALESATRPGWFGCDEMPVNEYLAITADYVTALSEAPGITMVQAGHSALSPHVVNDPRAPGDCKPKMKGRIRAGYFTAKDSQLNSEGSWIHASETLDESVPVAQRNVEPCIDLYINFGFTYDTDADKGEAGSWPMMTGTTGIDYRYKKYLYPATSWAAPLLTAHLIFLQDQAFAAGRGRLNAAELLDLARAHDSGVNLIDPLRNNQFTRFNLN